MGVKAWLGLLFYSVGHGNLNPKKWTFRRFFSWLAGLSVGTSLGLVFLTLVGIAIFVRTDFFQDRLRDQVVQAVEKVLQAKIGYKEADVEVFRFFPRISFHEVRLDDSQTEIHAEIKRVSISISLFYSIPLLVFRKIRISEAEVSGLKYKLSDTSVIRKWLERLRPQSSVVIPSRFQTFIRQIRFTDFNLELSLAETDVLKRKLDADLFLSEFLLKLSPGEIEASGELEIKSLKTGSFQFQKLFLSLEETLFADKGIKIGSLNLRHQDDFLLVRGDVWDLPQARLNLEIESSFHLDHYVLPSALRGDVQTNLILRGPWNRLNGKGVLRLQQFAYRTLRLEEVKTDFELRHPYINVKNFSANTKTGRVRASGNLNLEAKTNSQLNIEVQKISVGEVLGAIEPDLRAWQGLLNGNLVVSGGLDQFSMEVNSLHAEDFKILNPDQEIPVLEVDLVKLKGSLQQSKDGGSMKWSVDTGASQSEAVGNWNAEDFLFTWQSKFSPETWGKLYGMDVVADGQIDASYGGPFDHMELRASPNLSTFQLNSFNFPNLKGELRLQNRVLYGDPLISDGMEFRGGLYFKENGNTEFSNFNVDLSQIPLQNLWSLFSIENKRIKEIGGRLSGTGKLSGWVMRPEGLGTISVQDLAYAGDRTPGRIVKFNWRWEGESLSIADLYLETSKEGGGIRGELHFQGTELSSLDLKGTQVRVGDWALFFGQGLQIQSFSDFDLHFHRASSNLKANLELYDTMIGAFVHERSSVEINANKDALLVKGQLFKQAINLEFQGGPGAQLLGSLRINRLNLVPLIKQLRGTGLEFLLSGQGSCKLEYSQEIAKRPIYYKLVRKPVRSNCEFNFRRSNVTRANSSLHQIPPFKLLVESTPESAFSFHIPSMEMRTGRDRLRLSARYQSKNQYEVQLQGSTGLESVAYFIPFLSRSEGRFSVNGVFNQAGFTGSAELTDGFVLFKDSPFLLRNVEASLKSSNSVIDLSNLSGEARDGNIRASGRVQLEDGFNVRSALLVVQLNGPLIEPQNGLRFRTSGPISLKIDPNSAVLSGQVSVYDGTFRRRINLRSDLLKIFQSKEDKYQFIERRESYVDTWDLNISLKTTEPFVVRNNIADGAVNFDLHLGGKIAQPRISGNITLLEGQFNYNNRTFDLVAGSIQFTDTQSNIPRYDIRAETEISEYRVFVTFQGDANQQKIIYSSDPPLTEKEILALVSYGTPPGVDDSLRQTDPTESAALTGISFVTGQLQDTIEGALSGDLGIQRFQIYPAFYDETGKTELQLTVGTDLIRNKLEFNYSKFITAPGGHEVALDFRINRNISLVGSWRDLESSEEQNISGDFGGDIIFRFEFD